MSIIISSNTTKTDLTSGAEILDSDEFPTMESIQTMSGDTIEHEYTRLITNCQNPSQLLAKITIAALKIGISQPRGLDLMVKCVELHARGLGISPQTVRGDVEHRIIMEIVLRSIRHLDKISTGTMTATHLIVAAGTAFRVWMNRCGVTNQ